MAPMHVHQIHFFFEAPKNFYQSKFISSSSGNTNNSKSLLIMDMNFMYLCGDQERHELMNLVYLKFWGSPEKSVLHVLVWVPTNEDEKRW